MSYLLTFLAQKKFRWKVDENCRREENGLSQAKGEIREKRKEREREKKKRLWGNCFQNESV